MNFTVINSVPIAMDVTLTPPGELYRRDFRTGSEAARTGNTIKLLQVTRSY